ncbi:MAG TPA: hypothetical protein PK228_03905, partial [Saprospiraceae bacterium]|nr:hypothetical protein [Saprospiraceae bacterium]
DEEADNGDDGEVEELAFSERSLEGAPAGPVVTPPINLIIGDRMSPVFNLSVSNFQRDIQETSATKFAPTVKRGFMRFTFKGDFLHDEYAKVMVAQSTQVAQGVGNMQGKIEALKRAVNGLSGEGFSKANVISAIDNNIHGSSPNDLPNEPYTPSTNGIGLSYYSSQQLDSYDYFYHVLPFKKLKKLESYPPFVNIPLVDVFELGAIPDTSAKPLQPNAVQVEWSAANLYIGLSDLLPGDALSLLFMLRAGTEPDPDMEAPYIKWFYLAESNTWQPLPPNRILSDQTNGLTRTGIIQIATPVTMSRRGNTILPPDLHWLRASAVEVYEEDNNGDFAGWVRTVRAFPDFIDIRAQAVEAVFRSEPGNELSHLAQPLPANTITKLAISRSAIKKVEQPHPSFGGKLPETEGSDFYRRVSERLRHRDRAVTISDFERIVLEYSAEVALARCISHTRYYPLTKASELAPGCVTVAVVPDLLRRPGAVRPEPRFPKGDLEDMRQVLMDRANLFLAEPEALRVLNPQYEPVRILVELQFKSGDENLFRYQLDEALRRYLAPWLYDPAKGPVFGRILYRSQLIDLIEELEFVEFVKNLEVYQLIGPRYDVENIPAEPADPFAATDDDWDKFLVGSEKIQPGTARSILTTIAGKHRVVTVEERKGKPSPPIETQPRMIPPPPVAPVLDPTAVASKIAALPATPPKAAAAAPANTTAPVKTKIAAPPLPAKATAPAKPKTATPPPTAKTAALVKSKTATPPPTKTTAPVKPKTATPSPAKPPAPKPASKPPEKKTGAKTASKPRKK